MEALQSLHISTSTPRNRYTKKHIFLHLDQYLPASLPPSLCLTVTVYSYSPSGRAEYIEKVASVETVLGIINGNFNTVSLKTLLRDPKRRMGAIVKLSILIDYGEDYSYQGSNDAINQRLHKNLHLFRAALEIVPEFVLEIEAINARSGN